MENEFRLAALLLSVAPLRYTPSGTAVLEVVLRHESEQEENGINRLIRFDLPAKIIGSEALNWQHKAGVCVSVGGFLAQKSQRTPRPVLHILHITEYKG